MQQLLHDKKQTKFYSWILFLSLSLLVILISTLTSTIAPACKPHIKHLRMTRRQRRRASDVPANAGDGTETGKYWTFPTLLFLIKYHRFYEKRLVSILQIRNWEWVLIIDT